MHYLLVVFLIVSCGTMGPDYQPQPQPQPPIVKPPQGGDLSEFDKNVKPVLQDNCALSGCHSGQGFTENGQDYLNSNAAQRVVNGSMPPSYSPKFGEWSLEDKEIVLSWYDDNI